MHANGKITFNMHIHTDNKDATTCVCVCACMCARPNYLVKPLQPPPLEEQPGHGDQYT